VDGRRYGGLFFVTAGAAFGKKSPALFR